jgi:hypothetical protein
MVVLAGAPEQRLICGVLDQRVLEGVGRLRKMPALIEQLSLDKSAQFVL